jgi:flagellar protein FliJ
MFRFRLAPVQRLRENVRDERRRELAEALEAERKIQERQRELEEEIDVTVSQRRQASGVGAVNVEDLANNRRYELTLQAMKRDLLSKLAMVQGEIERRRLTLVQADQQVRVLEKLAETQLNEFETSQGKMEDREIDGAALAGWIRRNKESTR